MPSNNFIIFTVLKQKNNVVHSHFSQGIHCKFDLYKGKTVKSLKLNPSMLKLTGIRKTGPDLKVI